MDERAYCLHRCFSDLASLHSAIPIENFCNNIYWHLDKNKTCTDSYEGLFRLYVR